MARRAIRIASPRTEFGVVRYKAASNMNDDEFLTAFEARTLEEFHHRDHIKVAYLYLRGYSLHEAIAKVRTGLQALAAAWGAPVDELEKGYHETMTQAWVRVVHLTLSDCGVAASADAFCDQQPQLMQKTRLELFYSRERLMTWEAKREFVEPDLAPFVSVPVMQTNPSPGSLYLLAVSTLFIGSVVSHAQRFVHRLSS
jgi:hypothetical protein